MWREFALATPLPLGEREAPARFFGGWDGEAAGRTLAFSFPVSGPPEWRQRWQAIVTQVAVTPTHDAKEALLDAFAGGAGVRTLGFVNAHAFNKAVNDPAFAKHILGLDHVVRDGIGVVALYRLIGSRAGLNLNGTDLLPELFARFAGRRIALFGTRLDVADQVAAAMRRDLGCEVVTEDGFQADGHYLRRVAQERPALVVLGMGMPKQERVAHAMKHGLNQEVAIVCGGAILDFLSGHRPRAPHWLRVAGLEWAFRLSLEPRRLFGRYVLGNPLFLLRSAILALRPRPATPRPRPLRPSAPAAEPFGIGGNLAATLPSPAARAPLAVVPTPAASLQPFVSPPPLSPLPPPVALIPGEPAAAPGLPPRRPGVSVFSANRPVIARDDLFGRQCDLDRLIAGVLDQGGNALVYGPRGYGKTSLVRVFGEIADSRGAIVLYASCARGIDFDALMRSYLTEIAAAVPADAPTPLTLPPTPMSVPDVAARLAALAGSIVLIVDEFDRIERDDTRQNIVELIKDVSDLTANVRFVLVGVATDATAILGYHPSVQRSITCVPLARLSAESIETMFTAKARADRLAIAPAEVAIVTRLAAGSAYHAQLIGQKLVAESRASGRARVEAADLDRVVDDILRDAVLMDDGFARLARALRDPLARDSMVRLARAALAGPDDIVDPAELAPDLTALCADLARGGVLRAASPDPAAGWRFANAFLPQLLLMIDHRATSPRPVAA